MNDVVEFWFKAGPPKWFKGGVAFDEEIREKFLDLHTKAVAGGLDSWEDNAEDCLGLIILLDQFSRHLYRGKAEMYAADDKAIGVARRGIAKGYDMDVARGRNWFYMPFMHSEKLKDQEECLKLFTQMAQDNGEDVAKGTHYAVQHFNIVKKWGRFPHRNAILGRKSTPEEIAFLQQPGSSF